tara:strand:+ start:437 stop:628 length:192 start_codon:yes stop_codon:yes gene_type:complete
MNITDAQYFKETDEDGNLIGENSGIKATIDNIVWFIPLISDNTYYAEIMRQVEAGELTIADAE